MKKYTFFLFIVMQLFSCTENKKSVNSGDLKAINLSKKQLDLIKPFTLNSKLPKEILINDFDRILSNNILTDISYVKLETLPESLIGEISKILVYEDKIFILDRDIAKNLFVFQLDGKFISKVEGIGEGPNEIKNPLDFCINFKKKEIVIFDGFLHKVVYFDFNLKPKSQKKIFFRFQNMKFLNRDRLLLSTGMSPNDHIAELNGYNLLMIDSSFNAIYKGFEFSPEEEGNHFTGRDHLFQNDYFNVIWTPKFKNSIYQISYDGIISNRFILNFKSKEMPKEYYNKDFKEMFKISRDEGFYFYTGEYVENDNEIFMSLFSPKQIIQIFYEKSTKKYTYGKMNFKTLNFSLFFSNPLSSYKDKFVSVIETEMLSNILKNNSPKIVISDDVKFILNSVKKGDNPILKFYKISLKDEKMF